MHLTEKKVCATLLALAGMLIAGSAAGQGSPPVLYPATGSGGCVLVDTGGQATVQINLDALLAFPTRAAKFNTAASPGFTGTIVAFEFAPGILGLGNPTDGFLVEYQECLQSSMPLVTLTYQLFGTSASCGTISVVPYPGEQSIIVGDCDGQSIATHSLGPIIVNPGDGCSSQPWCALATQQSTWGRVKALYH